MKNQASQAIVQRFYDEVFTQKKMAMLSELFDPNLVVHDLDFGGVLPGGDLAGTLAAFPDVVATVNLWVVEDDLVTAYVTYNATHQAEFLGVPATGKAVTWSIIDIWRVRDGKIVELWHHIPNDDILEQIAPQDEMDSATEVDRIRSIERKRLHAMVEADMEVAARMHADDFQLINPLGGALSKEAYFGLVASGDVDYLVWEPITEIAVRLYGVDAAIIRYQSQMDIVVFGQKSSNQCWHTDSYEKRNGQWQVVWAQATTIQP
jgi:steroid delta-isomerase-like uncharacterized protein